MCMYVIIKDNVSKIAACRQLGMGVAAIFGPLTAGPAAHVQMVSTRLDVPHVEARLDCRDEAAKAKDRIAINVFPHCQTLNRALTDLLDHWEWDLVPVAILYESTEGLLFCCFSSAKVGGEWRVEYICSLRSHNR